MNEKSRAQRFDEVYQMVLIIVALSFDILWSTGRLPIAEIAVFIFVLVLWAYGNLKGEIWEYPLKLGSCNLAFMLLTHFYIIAVFGDITLLGTSEAILAVIALPAICVFITVGLAKYLKEFADRLVTRDILIGGTLGYVLSMSFVILFA
ncbi:MAG: hypothetical protein ACW975_03250 [Candidatus Thorarchaeota archaeon]